MAPTMSRKAKNPLKNLVVVLATNERQYTLSPVPARFNSTSDPVRVSIVRRELSSVTEPSYLGSVFSNQRSTLVP